MVTLEILKSYLKDLQYPGIDLMSDDDIANVFDKKNRLHFLTWFVKRLEPDIVIPSDEKSKLNMLADVLYDNGFCTQQTSNKFVQDNLEIQPQEQVMIFNRMLSNLRTLISTQESSDNHDIDYIEQINVYEKLDINIFPTLGPMKSRKPEERRQKLEECENEILQLKREIYCINNEFNADEVAIDMSKASLNVEVQDEISALMSNSSSLLIKTSEEPKSCFGDGFEKVTEDCARSMSTLLLLCDNKKLISGIAAPSNKLENVEPNSTISETIKHVAMLSEEILNMH